MFPKAKYNFQDIIGTSKLISGIKEKADKVSKTSSSVLIYGETGVGKELFVQAIHNNSLRKSKAFIVQNCSAIPPSMFESIFFGTEKGGFTGAENRAGLFEMAHGGTLYLDELNSMPLEFQGKLLRVIQEGEIRRVGGSASKRVDVRIITSVNEIPEKIVDKNIIRKDLFYRLNVVRLNIPPLRDRKEDIVILVNYFINSYNEKFKSNITGIDDDVLKEFIFYEWPGNVRQLKHVIEGVFNLKDEGQITVKDLEGIYFSINSEAMSLKSKLEAVEKQYIQQSLVITKNNISMAAKLLNIPRQTLQYKINKHNIK